MRRDAVGRLWAFALLLAPLAFTDDFSRGALVRVAAFALAATGVSLVSGISGQISLGHAALMGAGAFTSAGLAVHAGWRVPAAWTAGVALAAALGVVAGIPSLRLRGQYLALATLGAGVIVFQVSRQASSVTGGDLGLGDVPAAASPLATAFLATGLLAVALFVAGNLSRSAAGRRFRAVRDDEAGAAAAGVSVAGSKVGAFLISAVMGGVAGALLAHSEGFVSTGQFSPVQSFTLILAAVLGGLRSPYGGAVGVLAILGPGELAPGAFSWLERYQVLAWGPVALLVVFRWPDGLVGGLAGLVRRGAHQPAPSPDQPLATIAYRGEAGDPVALRALGVTKRFGGVVALDRVDLEVRRGTIHAVIGPNGSGKTTLLDCVTGFVRPDGGHVEILGRRATGRRPHALARLGVGRTFQSVALFGTMTARENVLVALDRRRDVAGAFGLGRGAGDAEALSLLATVGLGPKEATPAGALSYGERKRLELARALAGSPPLLLLDEPAAGRNESEILALGRFLRQLRAAGLTIVLVEHHMNFVLAIADAVTVLDGGRVVAEGPPSAVRADPGVAAAYLGESA